MKPKNLTIIAVAAIMAIASIAIGGFVVMKKSPPTLEANNSVILNYIKSNEETKPVSLFVKRNGEEIISVNADREMPLASTVKWVVAVEYAKQVDVGILDPNEKISLSDLDKYYLAGTDGEAHPNWLASLNDNGLIENDKVALREVARGMIKFSSNANTDYLLYRLGIENVNNGIQEMGMTGHGYVVPITATACISDYIQYETGLDDDKVKQLMLEMSQEEYNDYALKIHDLMNRNELPEEVKKTPLVFEYEDFQKIWSDRFVSATANDYINLMALVNSRSYFSPGTQEEIEAVVQYIMGNPKISKDFSHMGIKGGSSSWILTNAVYATDSQGNRTEYVIMFNDLEKQTREEIMAEMDKFMLCIITNDVFRNDASNELK